VSKLRKTSRAGYLTFVSDCATAVIAIAVYGNKRRSSNKAISGRDDPPSFDFRRDEVASGIERGELGSEEETDYATTE
jgi:hypothetical protein